MIFLGKFTSESPTKPGWYAYKPEVAQVQYLYEKGWTMVQVFDRNVAGPEVNLWLNIPHVIRRGRPTGLISLVAVADLEGEWCGPIVERE